LPIVCHVAVCAVFSVAQPGVWESSIFCHDAVWLSSISSHRYRPMMASMAVTLSDKEAKNTADAMNASTACAVSSTNTCMLALDVMVSVAVAVSSTEAGRLEAALVVSVAVAVSETLEVIVTIPEVLSVAVAVSATVALRAAAALVESVAVALSATLVA